MYIDVDSLRVDVQAEIDERVATLREIGGVSLLYSLFDRRGFHRAMIDEKEKSCLLDVVVGITRPARSLEAPFLITNLELDQLIGDSTSMNLADAVNGASIRGRRYAHSRFSMLLAGECDPCAMYGITTYKVKYLGIFLTRGAKRFAARGHVVKEVLHLSWRKKQSTRVL